MIECLQENDVWVDEISAFFWYSSGPVSFCAASRGVLSPSHHARLRNSLLCQWLLPQAHKCGVPENSVDLFGRRLL